MDNFSITDIANLSGIKPHTLRIWEQRYNIINPNRKEGNHRIYSNDDLKHILRITYLYHSGHKISAIAGLNKKAMLQLTLETNINSKKADVIVTQLLETCIDFDELRFDRIFNAAITNIGFENAIIKIAYPLLERIGLLWLTDSVIPAQEHFASNLIKRKIVIAIDKLKFIPKNKSITILFLPEQEFHEIPLLFMQYLLKLNGKHSIYFGANTPFTNLKFYIHKKRATHILFHLITNLTGKSVDDLLRDMATQFPAQQIVMSGPLTQEVQYKNSNITLLQSFAEMLQFPSI